MGMPVRIDNLLYEQAKFESKAEHRTTAVSHANLLG
jgi:hypothetical protein